MTFGFLIVILGSTHDRAPVGFAGISIGLALTPDPPGEHSGDQHVGESGPQHGPRHSLPATGR
jgi:hypothetical protein